MASRKLKFSFGMIVFNGDTFLKETLESIYDFAYEIIIVEGPDRNAVCMAGPDGGSSDSTMDILEHFPDPLKKIKIIRGTWQNKDEQSNRFISEATGDYIWQVDDDEVYKEEDLFEVEELLINDPEITAVSFYWMNFFKNFQTVMVADPPYEVWRLFKLKSGYRFRTHRPPTVYDPVTGVELHSVKPLHGEELARRGIYIYHYSYLTDKQVRDKICYHTNYRLKECGAGIPDIGIANKCEWLDRFWRLVWSCRIFTPLRKKMDRGFNYSYMENVWGSWEFQREEVESSFGVSPGLGPYRVTKKYVGRHPRSMTFRVASFQSN